MSAVWVSAAASVPSSPGDYSELGNYGLLGMVTGVLAWLAWRLIRRDQEKSDKALAEASDEVKRLNAYIAEKVVPALVEATRAANDSIALLRGKGPG